jgi:hypothetical protein
MLTPQDDLIGHQLPTTFDQIDNSDPAWMERLWYTGHPTPDGNLIFDIGLGHPNRNVIDAFRRLQRRAMNSAHLGIAPDPLTTSVGRCRSRLVARVAPADASPTTGASASTSSSSPT